MFKQAKKSLFLSLLIPTIIAIACSFVSIGVSLSQQSYRDAHAYINTEVLRAKNNFQFNMDLNSSNISALASNEDITDYLKTGNKEKESEIRNTLSDKKNTISYLIGLAIYPLKAEINPIVSYNISGAVQTEEMIKQNRIKEFLNSDAKSLLFIRKDAIHSSYFIFDKYKKENGICALINKIYKDDELVGFTVADFNSDSLYSKVITIPDSDYFSGYNFYLYDDDVILHSGEIEEILDESKVGVQVKKYSNKKNAIKANLGDNVNILITIPKANSAIPVTTISIVSSLLGLSISIGAYFICVRTTKSIIDPLEELVRKMSETSE